MLELKLSKFSNIYPHDKSFKYGFANIEDLPGKCVLGSTSTLYSYLMKGNKHVLIREVEIFLE